MSMGNPTLQEGAESEDGWVEYLHARLGEYFYGRTDFHFYSGDSKFTADTKKAVERFQREKGLEVDGIVGDQTWAAINLVAEVQPVGTDGHKPGEYVEKGVELRFNPEGSTAYALDDTLIVQIWNVGNVYVDADDVTPFIHVKTPSGGSVEPKEFVKIGGAQPGGWFEIWVKDATGAGPAGRYSAILQLPSESGGDTMQYEFDRSSN
jgi:hypothetical protein